MLLDLARERPQALALDDGTRRRSYGELVDRIARFARFLAHDAGLAPGSHLALLMGNRVEGIELLLGGIFAGLWVTPINWHLTEEEIDYVVGDSGARVLVTDDRFAGIARRVAARHPSLRVIEAGEELDRVLDAVHPRPLDLDAPAGGNMIYTSGTTGKPKGVRRARPASVGSALAGFLRYGRSI
ncbi:AMP-binding protein, partial [Myxococcota bacterium]|nr:AMP-binding protein [Myxococcota bacterium]